MFFKISCSTEYAFSAILSKFISFPSKFNIPEIKQLHKLAEAPNPAFLGGSPCTYTSIPRLGFTK